MKINEIIKEGDDNLKGRFYSALKGNQPVILAYSEGKNRNLDIRGVPVSLKEWEKVMNFALSDTQKQYNDFMATRVAIGLRDFMYEMGTDEDEYKFVPGRESSVVLYIQGPEHYLEELAEMIKANRKDINVDEVHVFPEGRKDVSGPILRLWWD